MPRVKVIPPGTPITYAQFRTGLTFAEAQRMMFVASEDSTKWRYKRRGTVLGFMRDHKQQLWAQFCAQNPHLVADETAAPRDAGPLEDAPF